MLKPHSPTQGALTVIMPKIHYQGEMLTMRELANRVDLSYDTVRMRYLRGLRGADLIAPKQSTNTHTLTYQGKTQSVRQWADELGIRYEALRQRLRRLQFQIDCGHIADPDEALGRVLQTNLEPRKRPYTDTQSQGQSTNTTLLESKPHMKRGTGSQEQTIKDIADKHGLPYNTVLKRYQRGWRGDALVQGKTTKRTLFLTVNGITKPLREWTEEVGIPYATAVTRIRSGKTDPEHILNSEKYVRYDSEGKPLPQHVNDRELYIDADPQP